ncbi:hypothetical protein RHSIM_Rhsim08G0014600 [Rhododendron simsii]|uniref:Uncharacterized protein n=1 Tax=Rhododendron simsii TaxID=118357 RepID=A0A834LIJ8_RHOSS|nr:hypothetical protein RHSIM_Rhsim08G0014600 [Rhododendron simsii]
MDSGHSETEASQLVVMSIEELKIRGKLEMDVERDLEAEIKDGIYHLALRLHRLYQHQKERNERELSAPGPKSQQGLTKNKILSEVNISIRMDGATKVEIKEISKEARKHGNLRASSISENSKRMIGSNGTKFDWAKSLRSEARPHVIKKKINNCM